MLVQEQVIESLDLKELDLVKDEPTESEIAIIDNYSDIDSKITWQKKILIDTEFRCLTTKELASLSTASPSLGNPSLSGA